MDQDPEAPPVDDTDATVDTEAPETNHGQAMGFSTRGQNVPGGDDLAPSVPLGSVAPPRPPVAFNPLRPPTPAAPLDEQAIRQQARTKVDQDAQAAWQNAYTESQSVPAGGPNVDPRAYRAAELEAVRSARSARSTQTADTSAAMREQNAQRELAMRQSGQRFYRDAFGQIQPLLDPDTNRPLYSGTDWQEGTHPKTGAVVLTKTDRYGQRQYRTPPIVANPDLTDQNLYYRMPDGTQKVAGSIDELTKSADFNVRRAAISAARKRTVAMWQEALQPMQATVDQATLVVEQAKQQADNARTEGEAIQRQIDSLKADPRLNEKVGTLLGFGGKPSDNALRLQSQLDALTSQQQGLADQETKLLDATSKDGELERNRRRANIELGLFKAKFGHAKYQSVEDERTAILQAQGKTPDQIDNDSIIQSIRQAKQAHAEAIAAHGRDLSNDTDHLAPLDRQAIAESTGARLPVGQRVAGIENGKVLPPDQGRMGLYESPNATPENPKYTLRDDEAANRVEGVKTAKGFQKVLDRLQPAMDLTATAAEGIQALGQAEGTKAAKAAATAAPKSGAEPAELFKQGVKNVGGVSVQQLAQRYGSGQGPVQPGSLVKLHNRVDEINTTLNFKGSPIAGTPTSLDPKVRESLGQESQYLDGLFKQRFAKLSPNQQRLVAKQIDMQTTSAAGAAARAAGTQLGPTAAFAAGFTYGAALAAPTASATKGIGPLIAGTIGGVAAGFLASKGQDKALETIAPEKAKELKYLQTLDAEQHPLAVEGGSLAAMAGVFKPSPKQLVDGLGALAKTLQKKTLEQGEKIALQHMISQSVFGGAMGIVDPLVHGEAPQPMEVLKSAATMMFFGNQRLGLKESINYIDKQFPRAFWKGAGIDAETFAKEYPTAVREVARGAGTPEQIEMVQKVNAAAKEAGVKVGDLARGRTVAEMFNYTPRWTQSVLPGELKPAARATGVEFKSGAKAAAAPEAKKTPKAAPVAEEPTGETKQLPAPKEAVPAEKPKSDYDRYQEIQARMSELTKAGKTFDDPEVKALWAENEAIKNRNPLNPGMPPEKPQPKETTNAVSEQSPGEVSVRQTPEGGEGVRQENAVDQGAAGARRGESGPREEGKPSVRTEGGKGNEAEGQAPVREEVATKHGEVEGEPINKEWTAFAPEAKGLGIPRSEMPQVHAEHRGALVNFLKGQGIESKTTLVRPTDLKPSQNEYSPAKVEKARKFEGGDRSILVSSDNHVVDGHHQWMAALTDFPDKPMKVIRLNAPIRELLPKVKEFPSAETAGGSKPEVATAPEPVVKRGANTPEAFVRATTRAASGTAAEKDVTRRVIGDLAVRLHQASKEAFEGMEVHSLTPEQWKNHPALANRTPDSAAAYDPDTNTLYLNQGKLTPENLASAIVHEAGHFAEQFYLGQDFTQGEWEKLTDEQRQAAADQYKKGAKSGDLKNDSRARREWVAMQFARVLRGDTEGMSDKLKAGLQKLLEMIRSVVRKWIGDAKLTTEALDRKILDMLGRKEEPEAPAEKPEPKPEPPAPKGEKPKDNAPKISKEADQALDDAFKGLLGTPAETGQEPIPDDRIPMFVGAARALIKSGIRTPEALAAVLEDKYKGGARKYSEALWDAFGMADKSLRGTHDWQKIYGTLDKAQAPATPTADSISDSITDSLLDAVANNKEPLTRRDLERLASGSTLTAKQVDEAAELGVVRAARAIVDGNGSPTVKMIRLIKLYDKQPNLTSKTSTSKINQAYSTPAPIAYLASQLSDISGGRIIVEPTAGNGMLLIEAPKSAKVLPNEIDATRRENLEREGYKPTTLDAASEAYFKSLPTADRMIMNPPFGAVKEEGQSVRYPMYIPEAPDLETTSIDKSIVMNTLRALAPDGKATLIIGSGRGKALDTEESQKAYITGANKPFFFYLYRNFNVTDHFTVSGDLYAKQGAGWPIDVITIDGRGKSALPFPWQKAPNVLDQWNDLAGKLTGASRVAGPGSETGAGAPAPRPSGDVAGPESGVQPGSSGRAPVRSGASGEAGGGAVGKPTPSGEPSPRPAAESPRAGEVSDEPAGSGESETGGVPGGEERSGTVDERPSAPIELNETGLQAGYKSRSESPTSMPALTPKNLVTPTAEALKAVEARRGNLDDFVAKELGYDSRDELFKNLDGGQVDAVALAIDNVKRGGALITGDQTGMGKGRTVAAMLRWAVRQGITPIFVTKNPGLYADMLRDMHAVGSGGLKPFMTNAGETVRFEDGNGNLIREMKSPSLKKQRELVQAAMDLSMLPENAKVVFTSYDQIKSDIPQGFKETKKEAFKRKRDQQPRPDGQRMKMLRQYAKKGFIVLDESHLAGGESDTGWRVTQMLTGHDQNWNELGDDNKPTGVYYTSATYAKTPKNMGVYFNTNVKRAVNNPQELANMMASGGVPLQQVLSSMLAADGQYIRRELDFSGIKFNMKRTDVRADGTHDPKVLEREKKLADSYTEPLREIINFNKDVLKLVELLNDRLKEEGITTEEGESLADQLRGTNFGDQLHNMVRQYLYAIKADGIADSAIEALKAGKSPVIAVHNTMESILNDLAVGQHPMNFDGLLHRYLDKATELTLKSPNGDKKKIHVNLEDLTKSFPNITEIPAEAHVLAQRLVRDRNVIRDIIKETDRSGIPASPIDHIRRKIEAAGYTMGEISGRQNYLTAEGKVMKRASDEPTKAGQNKILGKFNRDKKMALLLSLSGTTGISAHASKDFKNQQQRLMIVGQILPDINDMIQVLGRVFRKGQVVNPEYDVLNSTIPAELRLQSIFSTKLASLNANTTSAVEGVTSGATGGVDFMNQYGDEIVHQYLASNPEVVAVLRHTFPSGQLPSLEDMDEGSGFGTGDFARAVTGEVAILPFDDQQQFYDHLLSEYKSHIDFLDSIGENALRAQNLQLDAETVDKRTIFQGAGDSVFDGPAHLETLKVTSSRKPLKAEELPEFAAKNSESVDTQYRDYLAKSEEAIAKDMAELEKKYAGKENWDEIKASHQLRNITAQNQIGKGFSLFNKPVLYTNSEGQVIGYVTNVKFDPEKPLTPSAQKITVYINTEQQHVTLPMSQMSKVENFQGVNWERNYTNLANVATTKRVVTGNLIGGYQAIKSLGGDGNQGKVVTYTTKDGKINTGIMMPRKFDPSEAIQPVNSGAMLMKALRDGNTVSSGGGAEITFNRGEIEVRVPASKSGGGKFWQDKRLLSLFAGGEMRQVGQKMVGSMPEAKADDLVNFFNKDISDKLSFFETEKPKGDVAPKANKTAPAAGPTVETPQGGTPLSQYRGKGMVVQRNTNIVGTGSDGTRYWADGRLMLKGERPPQFVSTAEPVKVQSTAIDRLIPVKQVDTPRLNEMGVEKMPGGTDRLWLSNGRAVDPNYVLAARSIYPEARLYDNPGNPDAFLLADPGTREVVGTVMGIKGPKPPEWARGGPIGTPAELTPEQQRLKGMEVMVRSRLEAARAENKPTAQLEKLLEKIEERIRDSGPLGTPAEEEKPETYLNRVREGVKEYAKDLYDIPHYAGFKRVLNTWVGNRQIGIGRTMRTVQRVMKDVPSRARREAIANYIDAGGDRNLLHEWAEAAKGPEKAGYLAAQNLTPKELETADKIKGWFKDQFQRAVDGGVMKDTSYRQDYVTHIVKSPKFVGGMSSEYGGKIAGRFKYAQNRTFPNFHELEQAGYQTRTKDVAEIMAIYGTHLTNAIETRRLAKALLSEKNARGESLAKLILGRYTAEEGSKANYINDPAVATEQDITYRPVGHPAFRGWAWTGNSPETGKPILSQGEIGVHPEVLSHLQNAIGRSAIRQWYDLPGSPATNLAKIAVKSFDVSQNALKGTMLGGVSTFHAVHEYKRAIGNRVVINPILLEPINWEDPRTQMMVRAGLMLAGDRDAENLFSEGLGSRSLIDKIPAVGVVSRHVADYTFHQLIPALKWHAFNAVYARNLATYGRTASPEDVAYLTAQQINTRFGHLNLADLNRDPTLQHVMGWLLLAPDFLESNVRNFGQDVRGAAGAKSGREPFKALVFTAATIYILARIINQMIDDNPHYEEPFGVIYNGRRYTMRNEAEDLWRLYTKPAQFVMGRLSPALASGMEALTGRNWRGEKVTPFETLKEYLTKWVPISGRWIPGVKWLMEQTATGAGRTVTPFQEFLSSQGIQVSRHSAINDAYELATKFKNKIGVPEDTGTYPVSKYQQLRYAIEDGKLDRAQEEMQKLIYSEQHAPGKAKVESLRDAREKLRRGFEESLFRNWTKNTEMDKQFRQSLDPKDAAILAKAELLRERTWRQFAQMLHVSPYRHRRD